MDIEGRRYPRIASHHAVLVKTLGGEQIEEFAATKSLGLGGCGFFSDEPLAPGTPLEMMISVRLEVVKAKARVVYDGELPDGRHEIGVEFVFLTDADAERITQLFEAPAEP